MRIPLALKIRVFGLLAAVAAIFVGGSLLAVAGTIAAGFLFLCMGIVAIDVGFSKPETVTITSHAWTRSIAVDKRALKKDADWCEDVPLDAKILSRESKKKDTKGFGRRKTVYYSDWCEYEAPKWLVGRSLESTGVGLSPTPAWPALDFAPCEDLGCEREGKRTDTYEVEVRRASGAAETCKIDEAVWTSIPDQSPAVLPFGYLTGRPICSKLGAGAVGAITAGS